MEIESLKAQTSTEILGSRSSDIKATTAEDEVNQSQTLQSSNKQAVNVSSMASLMQALDATSDSIDLILEQKLTTKQSEALSDIHNKLDALFENDNLSATQEKSATALFEQADNIYQSATEKLTISEHKQVDKLSEKMNQLTEQLSQLEQVSSEKPSTFSVQAGQANELFSGSVSAGGSNKTEQANSGGSSSLAKKKLTVAELNALSVTELNKLQPNQLKKLNAKQLNKLNASLLNTLALPQLKMLSGSNVEKLNQSQRDKLVS